MTLQEIMLKLKETSLQNKESLISQEDLKKRELVYKRLMSLKLTALTKKADSLKDDKERLTMLFFSRAITCLSEQYLMDERKDIISLYVPCTGHENISRVFNSLTFENNLDIFSLKRLCNEEGIEMETSRQDEIYSIWFEVNTSTLNLNSNEERYPSRR